MTGVLLLGPLLSCAGKVVPNPELGCTWLHAAPSLPPSGIVSATRGPLLRWARSHTTAPLEGGPSSLPSQLSQGWCSEPEAELGLGLFLSLCDLTGWTSPGRVQEALTQLSPLVPGQIGLIWLERKPRGSAARGLTLCFPPQASPWGTFMGTWDMPLKIPPVKLNLTSRSVAAASRLTDWVYKSKALTNACNGLLPEITGKVGHPLPQGLAAAGWVFTQEASRAEAGQLKSREATTWH